MAYMPVPKKTKGGQDKIWVDDSDAQELLREMLVELKKTNMHLQQITDENIEEGDL